MSNQNFDAVARQLKDTVWEIGQTLDPDEDWMPVMEVFDADEKGYVFAFDPAFLENADTKDKMVNDVMVKAITGVGGKMVGTVFSAWGLNLSKADVEKNGLPSPSESPDRFEMVLITVIDPTKVRSYMSKVTRHESAPPELSDWEEWGANGMLDGRLIQPLQDALRDSSGFPNPEFIAMLESAQEG